MPCSPMANANFILLPGLTKEKIRESIYRDTRGKKRRANQSFRVASMKRACVIFKARFHRLRRLISFPYESNDRSNVYRSSGYRLCPFEKPGNVEGERFFFFFFLENTAEWSWNDRHTGKNDRSNVVCFLIFLVPSISINEEFVEEQKGEIMLDSAFIGEKSIEKRKNSSGQGVESKERSATKPGIVGAVWGFTSLQLCTRIIRPFHSVPESCKYFGGKEREKKKLDRARRKAVDW